MMNPWAIGVFTGLCGALISFEAPVSGIPQPYLAFVAFGVNFVLTAGYFVLKNRKRETEE